MAGVVPDEPADHPRRSAGRCRRFTSRCGPAAAAATSTGQAEVAEGPLTPGGDAGVSPFVPLADPPDVGWRQRRDIRRSASSDVKTAAAWNL